MFSGRPVILVVDDEEKIRKLIGEQLEDGGYKVILATSGDDAFEILQGTRHIDLIVTDVRMPDLMNGFDLIERALASRPDLRTIVMSGYTGESIQRAGLADRFLQKPFTLSYRADDAQCEGFDPRTSGPIQKSCLTRPPGQRAPNSMAIPEVSDGPT
jgi:CheY-like chemotaxis protein